MECPLCNNTETHKQVIAAQRVFHVCNNCKLFFVENQYRLNPIEEKKRYSFHKNSIEDIGYVNFLNQLISPAKQFIEVGDEALDFGCGPDPVLSKLLISQGLKCDYYDPYFFPSIKSEVKYDIVFASECFEHFFDPDKEITKISELLNPSGLLAVMTEFWSEKKTFAEWYYIKDPTHVCFYNKETFKFICNKFGFEELYCDDNRVIILKKVK
ncbi:MAG TPA: class I SAM-dependent methyltransferase [Bacteroidales bacterium]|nr:class I SAM-dependent methyltransferase [Bacteroidales bacterium]